MLITMKKYTILAIITLMTIKTYACNPRMIMVMSSSSTTGSFKLSEKNVDYDLIDEMYTNVNIPFRYEGKMACFEQRSGLELVAERRRGKFTGEIMVYTPQASFKNVDGEVKTFIDLDKLDNGAYEINMASFTCVDETVVAVEGYSGTIGDIIEMNDLTFSTSSSFYLNTMNNAASGSLSSYNEGRSSFGYLNFLPQKLEQVFEERVRDLDIDVIQKIDYLPTVITSRSLGFGAIKSNSTFSTLVNTKYGCTEHFSNIMSDLSLKKLKKKLKPHNIKYSKKRRGFKLKFKK